VAKGVAMMSEQADVADIIDQVPNLPPQRAMCASHNMKRDAIEISSNMSEDALTLRKS